MHTDHLGAPRELNNDAYGHIVWAASYKAWGATASIDYPTVLQTVRMGNTLTQHWVEQDQDGGPGQHLRFQGQYFDVETGLHYNRFRYYDPDVGRFVSQDPIGLFGGVNLYQFAPNPIEWIAPLGLRCDSPAQKLARKLRAVEGAQDKAVRVRNLPDGRVRYYEKEALAAKLGPTRGRSHVTEWNPNTGQVRVWEETYDHMGKVNRVHPKMNNGEILELPHYPPTKADIDSGKATAAGRATC